MIKRGTLFIVIALAVLSLVSAAAYNTAVVTSSASFTVKTSDQAKLALVPKATTASGNKDSAATISNGVLVLNFGDLQPNSTYTWIDLFKVKNNSAETLNVALGCTGTSNAYFSTDSGSTWTQGSASATGVAATTGEVQVSVRLTMAPTETLGVVSATITVTGTAQ